MEIWRDIDGYKGLYQVSNKGRVKSLKWGKERILRPLIDTSGYYRIILYNDSVKKTFKIHRLVAEAFIPNPNNLSDVNHIDECKSNNKVKNLEWLSHYDNLHHGTGLARMGLAHSKTIYQYNLDGTFIRTWKSASEVQRLLGINNANIIQCCRGNPKHTTAGGFIWKYKEED